VFGFGAATQIYLAAGATDMRKDQRVTLQPVTHHPIQPLETTTHLFYCGLLW